MKVEIMISLLTLIKDCLTYFYRQSPQRFIVMNSEDEDELEDDDICLQDLVAMETMEQVRDHDNDDISDCGIEEDEEENDIVEENDDEADDNDDDLQNVVMETEDQVFTLASYKSSTSIEPSFVNAILSHHETPRTTVSFGKLFNRELAPRF